MKVQTILTFILIKRFYCYVYDEKYPIILSTSQDLSKLEGVTLDTDHFGFSLDLEKSSKYLWVGAPKAVSPLNENETPGTLHTCNLNVQTCNVRPDNSLSNNEDGNNQLFGISVNTVSSKSKGTSEVCLLPNIGHKIQIYEDWSLIHNMTLYQWIITYF